MNFDGSFVLASASGLTPPARLSPLIAKYVAAAPPMTTIATAAAINALRLPLAFFATEPATVVLPVVRIAVAEEAPPAIDPNVRLELLGALAAPGPRVA